MASVAKGRRAEKSSLIPSRYKRLPSSQSRTTLLHNEKAAAQFLEALRYKPEGRGFDS